MSLSMWSHSSHFETIKHQLFCIPMAKCITLHDNLTKNVYIYNKQ